MAVRVSNRDLEPFWGASLRFILAAAVFWSIVLIRQTRLPAREKIGPVIAFGALQYGLSYALVYWGLVWIPAGFGQTILAIVPLATLLSAVAIGQEKMRWNALSGALLALAGIAVMSGAPGLESLPVPRILALIGSAFAVAFATVLGRSLRYEDPFAVNALAMSAGAIGLLVLSVSQGERLSMPSIPATRVALLYLALFGSVAVFSLYLYILKHWAASAASYAFVIYPLWAIILSSWIDAEQISMMFFVGATLTLGGVALSKIRDHTGTRLKRPG